MGGMVQMVEPVGRTKDAGSPMPRALWNDVHGSADAAGDAMGTRWDAMGTVPVSRFPFLPFSVSRKGRERRRQIPLIGENGRAWDAGERHGREGTRNAGDHSRRNGTPGVIRR
jgi:hypothetical protein